MERKLFLVIARYKIDNCYSFGEHNVFDACSICTNPYQLENNKSIFRRWLVRFQASTTWRALVVLEVAYNLKHVGAESFFPRSRLRLASGFRKAFSFSSRPLGLGVGWWSTCLIRFRRKQRLDSEHRTSVDWACNRSISRLSDTTWHLSLSRRTGSPQATRSNRSWDRTIEDKDLPSISLRIVHTISGGTLSKTSSCETGKIVCKVFILSRGWCCDLIGSNDTRPFRDSVFIPCRL